MNLVTDEIPLMEATYRGESNIGRQPTQSCIYYEDNIFDQIYICHIVIVDYTLFNN